MITQHREAAIGQIAREEITASRPGNSADSSPSFTERADPMGFAVRLGKN
jgi:hypothetical protein